MDDRQRVRVVSCPPRRRFDAVPVLLKLSLVAGVAVVGSLIYVSAGANYNPPMNVMPQIVGGGRPSAQPVAAIISTPTAAITPAGPARAPAKAQPRH